MYLDGEDAGPLLSGLLSAHEALDLLGRVRTTDLAALFQAHEFSSMLLREEVPEPVLEESQGHLEHSVQTQHAAGSVRTDASIHMAHRLRRNLGFLRRGRLGLRFRLLCYLLFRALLCLVLSLVIRLSRCFEAGTDLRSRHPEGGRCVALRFLIIIMGIWRCASRRV